MEGAGEPAQVSVPVVVARVELQEGEAREPAGSAPAVGGRVLRVKAEASGKAAEEGSAQEAV